MSSLKLLLLTDESGHSAQNSLYALARALRAHPLAHIVDVATRTNSENHTFFHQHKKTNLWVKPVDKAFSYSPEGNDFKTNLTAKSIHEYDAVWLRLPPPLAADFLQFLTAAYPEVLFINNPQGIYTTGSKEWLMNFPACCAPLKVCRSTEDILSFAARFPIVLKPFRDYGGRGIVRIENNEVWEGKAKSSLVEFIAKIEGQEIEYLGVKFLKNVDQGDKRIIVVNGKIMGASLRLPKAGSWICNVAMGGSAVFGTVDPAEVKIVKAINPALEKMGIVMYGVDTLMGDQGERVLSEINTTSIGGLPQMAKQQGKPLVEDTANIIWQFIKQKKEHQHDI